MRGGWRFGPAIFVAVLASLLVNCHGERATLQTCGVIMDRIVELELQEQGFRDPALAAQKRVAMRAALETELRECAGRKLPHGALDCVQKARTTEAISHVCLH